MRIKLLVLVLFTVSFLPHPTITYAAPVLTDFEGFAGLTPAANLNVPGVQFGGTGFRICQSFAYVPSFHVENTYLCVQQASSGVLTMQFLTPQSSLTFAYGYIGGVVQLFRSGILVGSQTLPEAVPGPDFRSAAISASSGFDTAVITTPHAFAMDNLSTVEYTAVPGVDMVPIPDGSVMGTFLTSTPLYYAPDPIAASSTVMDAGKSLWVIGVDESGEFYKVLLAGGFYWVPIETMGPNYDKLWNGWPLPGQTVE